MSVPLVRCWECGREQTGADLARPCGTDMLGAGVVGGLGSPRSLCDALQDTCRGI